MQQGTFDKFAKNPGGKRQGSILLQFTSRPPKTTPEEVGYKTKEQKTRFDFTTRKNVMLRIDNIGTFLALGNPDVPKDIQKKELSTTLTYVT